MIDIRKVCKIFLDFIYNEGILPAEIVKIIAEQLTMDLNDPFTGK